MELVRTASPMVLVWGIMLCTVGLSRADDTSGRPEVAEDAGRLTVMKFLSCISDNDPNLCFVEKTSAVMEKWIQSDPKLKSLAFKEMKKRPEEREILDTLGSGVLQVVDHVLTGMALERIKGGENDTGVDSSMEKALQRGYGVPVGGGSGGFTGTVYTTRVAGGKKKWIIVKAYFLAKLFIYACIVKSKIALVFFKILILIKLKFLGLAIIHTLIHAAKFHYSLKSHHVPLKGGEEGHEKTVTVVREPYFFGGYGGHGVGGQGYGGGLAYGGHGSGGYGPQGGAGYGPSPLAYRGWNGNKHGGWGAGGDWYGPSGPGGVREEDGSKEGGIIGRRSLKPSVTTTS